MQTANSANYDFVEGLMDIAERGDATKAVSWMADNLEGCSGAMVSFMSPDGSHMPSTYGKADRKLTDQIDQNYCSPGTNPVMNNIHTVAAGRTLLLEDIVVDKRGYLDGAFYQEVFKPREPAKSTMTRFDGRFGMTSIGIEQDPLAIDANAGLTPLFGEQILRAFDLLATASSPFANSILVDAGGQALSSGRLDIDRQSLGTLTSPGAGRAVLPAAKPMKTEFNEALAAVIRQGAERSLVLPGSAGPCQVHIQPGPQINGARVAWITAIRMEAPSWSLVSLMALHGLTPREASVTLALLEGRTNEQIAAELGLSNRSVRTYLSQVFAKTETDGKVGLVLRLTGGHDVHPGFH